jgi:hypothetical protein
MLFDIDALAAEFSPVEIKFRGLQYVLGETIEQVLGAVAIARTVADNAAPDEQLAILVPVLLALNPALGGVVGGNAALSLAERLVLQRVVTEAMERISKVPFRAVEQSPRASSLGGEVPALLSAV